MGYSISRLTLFVVISSVEDDLKNLILSNLGNISPQDVFDKIVYDNAVERLIKDLGISSDQRTLIQLLHYIDFGDLYKTLNRNHSSLPQEVAHYLKKITTKLDLLVPVRNRVMHSRPLNYDDLANVLDISEQLVSDKVISWNGLEATLKRIKEEPNIVLGYSIPSYGTDVSKVHHNLPIPDFDETGFLGRKKQVEDLVKLCLGPYPVITIVGEGGIGKTALALKVAYDVLDMTDCPFDAIVWTSSKTAMLTDQEIIRIQGAINDSLGMFQNVAYQLQGKSSIDENYIDDVLEYLREFKILLVIDNLETILDDRIRSFLEKLPSGSKILITSRIGLGAFEYPYKLIEMDESDAIQLLRALARIRAVNSLYKITNQQLAVYCNKMKNNPGFIKWFVSSVQTGKRPEEVFIKSDLFLEYCMDNVYHYLSESARMILKSMLCIPGGQSQAELVFLNDFDALELQRLLYELLRTNMVVMLSKPVGSSFESTYEISELARQYLSKKHPASPKESEFFTRKRKQIIATEEDINSDLITDPYNFYSIQMRSKSDLIVAKYLLDALRKAKKNDYKKANDLIEEAHRLAPEYFEVHRVQAIIKSLEGNITAAQSAYEIAIELEPRSAPLHKWYGGFLMRYRDDCEAALIHLTRATEIDPNSVEVKIELSRVKLYLSKYNDAIEILQPIINNYKTGVWNRRKAYDLYLQCFIRRAEYYISQHDEINALINLEEMLRIYVDCPSEIVDKLMVDRLRVASEIARKCSITAGNTELRNRAQAVFTEFNKEYIAATNPITEEIDPKMKLLMGNRTTGTIAQIEEDYGFITLITNPDKNIYFHRTDYESEDQDWNNLTVGERVVFTVGLDPHKRLHLFRGFDVKRIT